MVFCLFMQMNMVETQAATKVGNTKITSITQTGKKSVKVAFKKVSGAKGYTLQYRTAGGSWKTKNVTKNKLTISKLSTGKTDQFRVRAYKNVNGKKKYGKKEKIDPLHPPVRQPQQGHRLHDGRTAAEPRPSDPQEFPA